jgi:hypothetical protein
VVRPILLLALVCAAPAAASDVYVANSFSDNATGCTRGVSDASVPLARAPAPGPDSRDGSAGAWLSRNAKASQQRHSARICWW